MKAKDLICVVGAPAKTAVEGVGIITAVGAVVGVIFGIIYLIANALSDSMASLIGSAVLYLYFGGASLLLLGVFAYCFVERTKDNYGACKEYWSTN